MSKKGKWTARDMPDLTGKVAIVTGANSGIGLEAALALARKGAHVVIASRNLQKCDEAAAQIRAQTPACALEIIRLDLADLASVRGFAGAFREGHDHLHLLINNAGVMAIPYRKTADGFEMQFGTNHLGHFALTGLLLAVLLDTPGARVVTVSSGAHTMGKVHFDDLQRERSYRKWEAYGQSKLANLLFAYELQRRLAAVGAPVISVAAHPGYANTNLQAVGPQMEGSRLQAGMMKLANRVLAQSQEMGALPTLFAATAPAVKGGDYVGPGGFMEQRGYPVKVRSNAASYDVATARRLWEGSSDLTGVDYALLQSPKPAAAASPVA